MKEDLGDGVCKPECNSRTCEYDAGDCVKSTQGFCASGCFEDMLGDGVCQEECLTSACENDRGDCESLACSGHCYPVMLGNGICEESCKVEECQWDWTDCDCAPGCSPPLLANSQCDKLCNTEECGFDNGLCVGAVLDCAEGCFEEMVGDGKCDEACNLASCHWDDLDCGCAPSCNYEEIASCKPECLVPDCAYGELAGFPPCSDPVKRLTQRYFDIQHFEVRTVFPETRYDPVQACMPSWTDESWEDIFYGCSPYSWYYPYLSECLYNVGMCESPAPTCERVARFGCFQCTSGLLNLAGQCLLQCPQGTAPHPLVTDMCVPAAVSSVILYISPSYTGNDSDGSWERPYRTIDETYHLWLAFQVKILLVGPRHYMGSSTPAYLPELYDWQADIDAYRERSITISPQECEERAACERSIVLVRGLLLVMSPPSSSYYCREWKKPWSLHFSNIDFEEDPANTAFFPSFLSLGSGVLSLTNITFAHFHSTTHLITFVANNHLRLFNVDFLDVVVSSSVFQSDEEWKETINCRDRFFNARYSHANFTYENGQITYSSAVSGPLAFLRHGHMGTVIIVNVTISELQCPTGFIFVDADSWAYFELRDSLFENNVMSSGFFLRVVSTQWTLPTEPTIADVPSFVAKLNYNISTCTFRNNSFTAGSHLSLTFQALMQNVLLSNLTFQDTQASLISIASTLPPVKQRIKGPVYLDPITNLRISFPPALVTLQAIAVHNCSSALFALLHLTQIPYTVLSVQVTGPDQDPVHCYPAVLAERGYAFTLEKSQVERLKCGRGTPGLELASFTGPISLRNSQFAYISSTAAQGSAISISTTDSVLMENLIIASNQNQGCGVVSVAGSATASLQLFMSVQENNTATEGGALCLSNLKEIFIDTCMFTSNDAIAGGSIQLTSSTSAPTSLTITRSVFVGNHADTQGGALHVFFSSSATLLRLAIQDSVFEHNRGFSGAVLYLSSRVELVSPSYLSNVTIARSHSVQAAITLTYQSGTLAMSSLLFEDNTGESESCLYVQLSYSSGGYRNILSITDSVFRNNTGVYTTQFPYSISGIHILFFNVTLESNSGIGLYLANGLLESTNSGFLQNTGAALMLIQQSKAVLRLTKFEGNQAKISAAAVQLVDQSSLYCDFCEFTSNQGEDNGGAVQAEGSSVVTILNSVFRNNQANDGSALKLLMASPSSLFNCSFTANFATRGTIVLMSTSLTLASCQFRRNLAIKAAGLIIVESVLALLECQLENQSGATGYFLFITSLSSVSLNNTQLSQGESQEEGAIYVEESSITLWHCQVKNIVGRKGALIYAFGSANVTVLHTHISASTALESGFIYLWLSAGSFRHSTFSSYQGTAIAAQESSVFLSNCSFTEGRSETGAGLHCLQCLSLTLEQSQFTNLEAVQGGAVDLEGGERELTIHSCNFAYNRACEGGALYALDVHLKVSESFFTNNSAFNSSPVAYASDRDAEALGRGGAMAYVVSTSQRNYSLYVNQSVFTGNLAEVKGGAIAWTGPLPSLSDLILADNTAPYGPDTSSFAIAITVSPSYLSESGSGQAYLSGLIFSLIDHYGQIVTSDSSTKAGLSVKGSNANVYGHTEVTASKGLFTFDDFSIAATPGTSVNLTAIVSGLESLQKVIIFIRFCKPGEAQIEEKCVLCRAPKYSFSPADSCRDCPSEAVCAGGASVYPKAGYWRYDWLSTTFLRCPNPAACLNATNTTVCEGNRTCLSQGYTPSFEGTCLQGYTGNLCQTCALNYHRTAKIWCTACPSYSSSLALSICYALSVTCFSVFIVVTSIKSARKPKSLSAVYLKLFMNYLQLAMLMGSFNLSWPTLTKEMLNIQDSAGSFSEHLFTTDCLTSDFDENEAFFTKLVLLSAAPIFFFLVSSLSCLAVAATRKSVSVLRNELVASGIILFFLLHPSVMRVMFGAFNCEEVKPSEYWVSGLLVRCWEGKHLTFALTLALPAIVIWGVGLPGVILGCIVRYRKQLRNIAVKVRFGFLVKGYADSRYYWEFIIIYRKLIIIGIATFLSRIAKMTQALIALSVLVLSLVLQHHYKPYNHISLNTMEQRSILVSITTLFFGLYFLDGSLSAGWQNFFFTVILAANVYFLQFWLRRIMAACFVMAVKRISWLHGHFVIINETLAVSNQAFIKRFKSSVEASKAAQATLLPTRAKDIYLQKLQRQ